MAGKDYFDNVVKNVMKIDNIIDMKKFDEFGKHNFLGHLHDTNQYNQINKLIKERLIELEKKMTLAEFNELYRNPSKGWQFDLFKIICNKCNSDRVEFKGEMELETGWYAGDSTYATGDIITKCHNCGNSFVMNFSDVEK